MASPSQVAASDEVILPPPSSTNPLPSLPAALRLDNREQLIGALQSVPGRQLLVFESDSLRTLLLRQVVSDPKTRVFKGKKNWDEHESFPFLNMRGLNVIGTRLLGEKTEGERGESVDVVTYFLRADPAATLQVTRMVLAWTNTRTNHRIFYLPSTTALCDKILSSTVATNPNVSIQYLQLDIYPIESDVLSLEYPHALKEADVQGAPSALITTVARSLLKIQHVTGTIPRIQALGPLGEEVARKMMTLTMEQQWAENPQDTKTEPAICACMILDRKLDLITPMLTPLTYEGLLDEVVGIDCGFLGVRLTQIEPESDSDELLSLGLADVLFTDVRDMHVERIGSYLQTKAKTLQESHSNFTDREKTKDLAEIHQFVKNIPAFNQSLRALSNHIHLAEQIKTHTEEPSFRLQWQTERSMLEGESCYDLLEEWISCQYPVHKVLRLLCLQSMTGGGIKSSKYDTLRVAVVQTYGFEYLLVLNRLEKAGMLKRRDWMDTSPFSTLRKQMFLINADVNPTEPDDASYVSSGYAPLSVRLVQGAMKGWKGANLEVLKELPGRLVDVRQTSPPEDFATAVKRGVPQSLGAWAETFRGPNNRKPVLLVVWVGPITFMEIAALRFLNQRASFPYHILMCATKISNGDTLLQNMTD